MSRKIHIGGEIMTVDKFLAKLRKVEPATRELMLTSVARTYGDGFARVVRGQLSKNPEGGRR